MKKQYNYIQSTNDRADRVIMVEIPDGESYYPYYEGLTNKKAKLIGVKLAGGCFYNDSSLQAFLDRGGKVYKVRKGTKPLYYKPDGRKATPILSWDETEILDNEVETGFGDEYFEGMSKDEIREQQSSDPYFWQVQYDLFLDDLTEIMKSKNKSDYWKVAGYNMGWLKRSGHKVIEAATAKDLLQAILPDTDCTIQIYRHTRGFKIINYHHDAPTGESYIVTAITERTYQYEQ